MKKTSQENAKSMIPVHCAHMGLMGSDRTETEPFEQRRLSYYHFTLDMMEFGTLDERRNDSVVSPVFIYMLHVRDACVFGS